MFVTRQTLQVLNWRLHAEHAVRPVVVVIQAVFNAEGLQFAFVWLLVVNCLKRSDTVAALDPTLFYTMSFEPALDSRLCLWPDLREVVVDNFGAVVRLGMQ